MLPLLHTGVEDGEEQYGDQGNSNKFVDNDNLTNIQCDKYGDGVIAKLRSRISNTNFIFTRTFSRVKSD